MPIAPTTATLQAAAKDIAQFDALQNGDVISVGVGGGRETPVESDNALTDFSANEIAGVDCWRLVHDGSKVLSLHQSSGRTLTRNELFGGTKEECDAEIARLDLTPIPEPRTRAKITS